MRLVMAVVMTLLSLDVGLRGGLTDGAPSFDEARSMAFQPRSCRPTCSTASTPVPTA